MINAGTGWNMTEKPRALLCHICGREYGTTSLKIHLPQCEKLWHERESLKPKSERRPLPQPLTDIHNITNIQQYNQQAYTQYQTQSMITCEYCGRRFADDRIAIHHRSCTADKPAKRVEDVAVRTVTGQAVPHRLDTVTTKQPSTLTSPSNKDANLKSPVRPKTGTVTPKSATTVINKPPASPSVSNVKTNTTIDIDDYNELKMRVSMLENQLDMLLSTIGVEENRAQSKQALNECTNCGAISASVYCAQCGTKQ